MNFSWLPAGRYVVNADGRPVRTKSARKQFLQGWACHYNVEHTNYKNGLREIFLPGCWGDSMYGVFFLRDHRLNEPKMADQDDGDMSLHDSDTGLAIRVDVKDGMLDRLEGRDQLSVGYHTTQANLRSDGVLLIKSAVLLEVSACHVGAVRQTWSEICDADDVGPLATDSKNWAFDGAALGFTRALAKL